MVSGTPAPLYTVFWFKLGCSGAAAPIGDEVLQNGEIFRPSIRPSIRPSVCPSIRSFWHFSIAAMLRIKPNILWDVLG